MEFPFGEQEAEQTEKEVHNTRQKITSSSMFIFGKKIKNLFTLIITHSSIN